MWEMSHPAESRIWRFDGLPICGRNGQNLDVAISEIDPIVNRVAAENRDFYSAPLGVALVKIREVIG